MSKVRREIEVGHQTCLAGFSGRDSVDSAVFDSSTLEEGGVNEVQTVTITGGPTGGTFTLSFNGQATGAIAFNASAAAVQAALRALSRVGPDGVAVAGNAGGPYTVTFQGRHGRKDVPLLGKDNTLLTGGTSPNVTVTETTKGSSLYAGMFRLLSGTVLTKTADGKKVREYTADDRDVAEVQVVTITGSPTGGTFTLTFDGETTAGIAFNASAATVLAALNALSNVDAGDLEVTGNAGGPYTITFSGRAGEDVPTMTASEANLTGGTSPAVGVAVSVEGSEGEQIVGIFDGNWEFLDGSGLADRAIPVYNYNAVFIPKYVKNYALFETELLDWAQDNACKFKSQGNH